VAWCKAPVSSKSVQRFWSWSTVSKEGRQGQFHVLYFVATLHKKKRKKKEKRKV